MIISNQLRVIFTDLEKDDMRCFFHQTIDAKHVCTDCNDRYLCESCHAKWHGPLSVNREHKTYPLSLSVSTTSAQYTGSLCDLCTAKGPLVSCTFCPGPDGVPGLTMCVSCCMEAHSVSDTRHHLVAPANAPPGFSKDFTSWHSEYQTFQTSPPPPASDLDRLPSEVRQAVYQRLSLNDLDSAASSCRTEAFLCAGALRHRLLRFVMPALTQIMNGTDGTEVEKKRSKDQELVLKILHEKKYWKLRSVLGNLAQDEVNVSFHSRQDEISEKRWKVLSPYFLPSGKMGNLYSFCTFTEKVDVLNNKTALNCLNKDGITFGTRLLRQLCQQDSDVRARIRPLIQEGHSEKFTPKTAPYFQRVENLEIMAPYCTTGCYKEMLISSRYRKESVGIRLAELYCEAAPVEPIWQLKLRKSASFHSELSDQSLLHHAVDQRWEAYVATLLRLGCDPEEQDSKGRTPRDRAKSKKMLSLFSP